MWLWVDGGGLELPSWGEGWATFSRLTGLLGAFLALVQVVLLARLPWLERLVGFDRLTRWHRWNGHATLWLVLAHAVTIVIGYMLLDRIGLWHEIEVLLHGVPRDGHCHRRHRPLHPRRRQLDRDRPVAPCRTAGGTASTSRSTPASRSRWFHQIPTGNEFIHREVATWYWRSRSTSPSWRCSIVFRVPRADRERVPIPAPRRRGRRGGARRRLAPHRRARGRAAAGAGWPVLPVAVPHPTALPRLAPVLDLRGAGRTVAAHHGARPRRLHPGDRRDPRRAPASSTEGPFGVFTPSRAEEPEGLR